MERKDYADKFMAVKNDILKEIREIVGVNNKCDFKNPCIVYYCDGEVAIADNCTGIIIDDDGCVILRYFTDDPDEEHKTSAEGIFSYSDGSFINLISHLKKEVREQKLTRLRNIIEDYGGHMNFDETFVFDVFIDDDTTVGPCYLTGLSIKGNGELSISDTFDGDSYENTEKELNIEAIDKILAYVESFAKREFTIRVSGSFSRTFDIKATSYEEAQALAKKEWEINPLYFGDSNGENWDEIKPH